MQLIDGQRLVGVLKAPSLAFVAQLAAPITNLLVILKIAANDSMARAADGVLVSRCVNNTYLEDEFEVGVEYVVIMSQVGWLSAYDNFGVLRGCRRDRFGLIVIRGPQ